MKQNTVQFYSQSQRRNTLVNNKYLCMIELFFNSYLLKTCHAQIIMREEARD